jgi:hypothetical protein
MLPPDPYPAARRPPRLLALQPPSTRHPNLHRPRLNGYELSVAHRLAVLYQTVFPEKPEWRQANVPANADKLLDAVGLFLRRVCSNRFPIIDETWEETLIDADWRLAHIPLDLQGYDTWYDEEWDEYDEPIPLLLRLSAWNHLRDGLTEEEAPNALAKYPGEFPPDFQLYKLDKVLEGMALDPPLDSLPDLIRMAMERCGNNWLDYSNTYLVECGCYPPWEDWDDWYESWQEAEPILLRVNGLIRWVKEEGTVALELIIAALLAAHAQRQETEEGR